LRPIRPLSPASPLAAPPLQAETVLAGPFSPRVGRVFVGNTSSLLVHVFRAGRLSHVSLSTGSQMSVPSPTSSRPSSPAPPPIPGHRAPLSSAPRVPLSRYHLALISPPLISLLNLSSSRPVFNGVKAINAGVNRPGQASTLAELHRTSPRSYFPLSPPEQPPQRRPSSGET
jgi:hypothetical protein